MVDFDIMQEVIKFFAGLPGLLLALVLHEYAHARVAVAMGDFTPKLTGRLTLNPLAHIDPIGFIMLLVVHFGWAKPVMVNPRNFKDMKMGNILVALAGPATNFLVAFVALTILTILYKSGFQISWGFKIVFSLIVLYNIYFGIFNLLPIPPLDGSKILLEFLPGELAYKYMELERYGFIILIVILAMMMHSPFIGGLFTSAAGFIMSIFEMILNVFL